RSAREGGFPRGRLGGCGGRLPTESAVLREVAVRGGICPRGGCLQAASLRNAWAYLPEFAGAASAPFRVTAPLTLLGSTVISVSLAATSAGTSFCVRPPR